MGFHVTDQATAKITVDCGMQSVVITPGDRASIGVFPQEALKTPGGASLRVFQLKTRTSRTVICDWG